VADVPPLPSAPPPRWTVPVWGPRVRVSAGLVAWLAGALILLAAGSAGWPFVGGPLLFLVLAVASMAVHEGAHAWAAHNLGYRVEWVVLGGLAGLTAYYGRDDRPLDRAAVALAGPAASAAAVIALLAVRATVPDGAVAADVLAMAIALNALGLVANLVPVAGSDGALLLRGLHQHHRRRRVDRADPVDRG
jgi:hypothetical protein